MALVGLLVYCILLLIRPADWVKPILHWPLEFAVLGVTMSVGVLSMVTNPRRRLAGGITPHLPLLSLWVILIFLSNVVHGNLSSGLEYAWIYAKIAVTFFIFWFTLDSVKKLRGVILLLVVLTSLLGLQGIYQHNHKIGWAGQPLYWGGRIDWIGLWDGANVLSLLFVTTVPFILETVFGPSKLFPKLLAGGASIPIMIGLYLANSRGAWLALGVIFLVYFKKRIGTVGLIVGLLAVVLLVKFGPSRLTHSDERDTSSSQHRIDMWAEGLEMLKYNPILGIGKGQFENYTGTLIAHNTFVQNMGETGLLGLFAWVGLVYTSFLSGGIVLANQAQLSAEVVSLARAILVSLIGYLSASMFISTDFELLYILMALSAAVLRIARRESELELSLNFGPQRFRNIAVIEVAGIFVMYLITRSLS